MTDLLPCLEKYLKIQINLLLKRPAGGSLLQGPPARDHLDLQVVDHHHVDHHPVVAVHRPAHGEVQENVKL